MPRSTKTSSQPQGPGCGIFVAALALVAGLAYIVQTGTKEVIIVETCEATAEETTKSLKPSQTANAATMARIGKQRGLPARAVTIAIATAVQESKLENINYGDRDSVGLFQQRPSQGWGTVEQIMDPVYSTNKFYDELIKIDGYEDMVITEAAQKVQRSAYPAAYGDHEPEGRVFASTLTGYSPAGMSCTLRGADSVKDPSGMVATIVAAYEDDWKAQLSSDVQARTVTVSPSDTQWGWAMAHYAMAHASEWQLTQIDYDGHRWTRSESGKGWLKADDVPAGSLVMTFA